MKIKLDCPCGNEITHDVEWENTEGEIIDNRGMEMERVHYCKVKIKCPECQKIIRQVDVYEYPEGEFNYAKGYYEVQ